MPLKNQIIFMAVFNELEKTIASLSTETIQENRRKLLDGLTHYIQKKAEQNLDINLNFICTHNSRRSHLAQVWAQTMAHYFGIKGVFCYSGGTEATALFPMAAKTLIKNGFLVKTLSEGNNPVYSIKYSELAHPVICFSKKFDDEFNPYHGFAAIMTCSDADVGCPFVPGAEMRIPITYEDPKVYDHTPQQEEKYLERSLQIAGEMFYVFSKIKK